jgi:hypothetical protein
VGTNVRIVLVYDPAKGGQDSWPPPARGGTAVSSRSNSVRIRPKRAVFQRSSGRAPQPYGPPRLRDASNPLSTTTSALRRAARRGWDGPRGVVRANAPTPMGPRYRRHSALRAGQIIFT